VNRVVDMRGVRDVNKVGTKKDVRKLVVGSSSHPKSELVHRRGCERAGHDL
jgi:hypothetical protein